MKKDTSTVLQKVANFLLNRSLSDDKICALEKHLSFDSMKNNSSVNYDYVYKLLEAIIGEKGKFMRCGEIGSYKKDITPEMEKCFDKWIDQNIEGQDIDMALI